MTSESKTGARRRKPARAWEKLRTCNSGETFQSLEARLLLAFSAKVNFQPATAPTVAGYVVDAGNSYAARAGTGMTYGWNTDNRSNAVDRNSLLSPNQLQDTFVRMQSGTKNYSWDLAVPNGTYTVKVSAGDASTFLNTTYRINVEGVSAINGSPTSTNRWLTGTVTATVNDGKLTVSNGSGAKNNVINYIEITPVPPGAPTTLAASPASATQVNLTWVDTSNNEDGFRIERSTDGGANFTEIGTVAANVRTYSATGLTPTTSYGFRVRAYHDFATSAYANPVTVFTPLPTPSNLAASAATSTSRVKLTWSDVSGEDGYRVLRSSDGTNWTTLATSAANATAYEENAPAAATSYTYRVVAFEDGLAAGDSIPASATLTTAPFRVFDTSSLDGKPDLSSYGIESMLIAYEWTPDPLTRLLTDDRSAAIEDNVKRLAAQAYAAGQSFVMDLESWALDTRFAPKNEVKAVLRRMIEMVQWAREGRPGLRVGFYDTVGPTPNLGDVARMQKAGDVWRGIDPDTGAYDATHDLVRHLSFLAPNVYAQWADPHEWWRSAQLKLAEARRQGSARVVGGTSLPALPVYPFMWPRLVEAGNVLGELPGDYWQMQLATVREKADGVILWDADRSWSMAAAEPWWQATQSFLAQPSATVAAPSAVTVNRVGTYVSWTDNSWNESGFVIERSTNGGPYQEVAMVPANDVTWKDDYVNSGVSYAYRVRASSGLTRSAAATAAPVIAARDGLGTIYAATHDAAYANVNYGYGVLINSGGWFKYGQVHFGTGANQFAAQVEVPPGDTGQIIEVRIDSLTGPMVGLIDLAPSAGWGDSVLQTDISQVSGIHDVYVVVREGDPSVVSGLSWIKFAYNGPPAPPAKPIALSAVNSMDLEWTDYSGDEDGFEIQRAADGGEFATVATVAAGDDYVMNHSDSGLSAFRHYSYRVRAFNEHGYSDWSPVAQAGYAVMGPLQNLALNKSARQSSTEYGGTADKAADGNTDGVFNNGSVTHTAGNDNERWWEVDLGDSYDIAGIEVWNRVEAAARLTGFYIFVSETPFESTDVEATKAQAGVSWTYFTGTAGFPTKVAVDGRGRYVRIQLPGSDYLSLAEVKVFG